MKNSLFFLMLILSIALNGQVSKTIAINTAGTLTTALTAAEKLSITNLTISGTIDARDFNTMRDQMPAIAVLDISAVQIAEYNAFWYVNPANEIPESAFSFFDINKKYSNLKTISLPLTATSIGRNAFNSCIGLTTVIIPASVTSIIDGAFWGCTALSSITIHAPTPPTFRLYELGFEGVNKTTCKLYVPAGTLNAYKAADQWKDFVNILEIGSGETQGNYLINFSGSGDASVIDSVEVNNLTQNKKLLIKNGNSLKLTSTSNSTSQVETEQLMNYQGGDRLLIKGYSGKLCTILTDIPTESKTVNFEFVTCKDADGNYYATVKIGNQIWMAENLRTTKYRNGDAISLLQSDAEWTSTSAIGKCCRYYDTYSINGQNVVIDGYDDHGLLYNSKAVYDNRNIAPEGWHVSLQEDWNTLVSYLGGSTVAGTKLKDSSPAYWGPTYKTNESGFTARAGGARNNDGSFANLGLHGYWWVKTEQYREMQLTKDVPNIFAVNWGFEAYSVRCVKNPTSSKYVVLATASPAEGGTVTGSGSYEIADISTVEATPNYGYKFSNWTENGVVVYNWASYPFVVSKNRTLVANFIRENTISVSVQPQISINPGVVNLGAKVTITGKNFTPNKTVKILIVSKDGGFEETINADAVGNIKFDYTAPSVVSSSNGVEVEVIVRDNTTEFTIPSKWFKIIVPKTPNAASINILSLDNTYKVNQPITVSWTEMLYKAAGGVNYPFEVKTGLRSYSYNIEYKTSENGSWIFKKLVQGSAMFDKVLMQNFQFEIDQAYAYCQVRIVDNHNRQSIALSNVFAVEPSILGTELAWDYSFPNRTGWPRGVAADGVARVYLKVRLDKIDKKPTVTVKLSADGISETSVDLLGKVMKATVTDKYHTEANAADSITDNSNIVDADGYVWFWYVAPVNFTRGGMSSPFAYASERTVNANISVSYEGGSPLPDVVQPIKIVRPPLMMVHGLNGSHDSFKGFHYSKDNIKYYFSNYSESNPTKLFIVNNSVDLIPNASFNVNASLLLTPDCVNCGVNTNSTNYKNSFQGNIETIRSSGFASNQVDYVCHSMGGCVLRTAIDKYSKLFYGKEGGANSVYKTYEKGFVNKTITINTPHNGSPIADLVTDWGSLLSGHLAIINTLRENPILNSFLVPDNGNIALYKATDAVVNLQVSGEGSVVLKETTVKNHLIAGDMNFIPSALDVKSGIYKSMIDFVDIFWKALSLTNPEIIQFAKYDKIERTNRFVEWYCKSKKFASPWSHGDFVVSLASQLAMSEIVGAYPSNISVFNGISTFHISIVDQTEVGNRVLELLNSDVNGNSFANSIAANNVHSNVIGGGSLSPQKTLIQKANTSYNTFFNTDKIEIINPIRNDILFADSTLNMTFILKDTANLAYITYYCLGNSDITISRAELQKNSLQINPNFLGKQKIMVSAVYDKPEGILEYSDTLTVNVQSLAQLISFQVLPKVMNIYKGIKYFPTFKATFSNGVVSIPFNNEDLDIEIDNPSVVKYAQKDYSFEGLDTLTTFAKITYKGISDTIYFSVMDTISQAIPDNINGLIKNIQPTSNLLGVNAYPNPFTDSFTFEYTLPTSGDSKLEVYNIYGIKVKEFDFGVQEIGFYKKQIDMKGLMPGIYLFKLSSGRIMQNGRLLKI